MESKAHKGEKIIQKIEKIIRILLRKRVEKLNYVNRGLQN
jgi:hypothetical protein